MKLFPDEYPDDLYDRIVEDGAGENTFMVYRISELGVNNRDAFLSTYQEQKNRDINNRDAFLAANIERYDIGLYSTSCFDRIKEAKSILRLKERYKDRPRLLYGKITPDSGLSMETKNSKSKRRANKHHIDWWIYKDENPSINFEIVNIIEGEMN